MHLTTFLFVAALPLLSTSSPLPTALSTRSTTTNNTYPLPLPCTGEGCTYTTYSLQDSNVIAHTNGTLFRYSKSTDPGTGLTLATAPSLSGPWTRQANVLVPTDPNVQLLDPLATNNASQVQQWAPEVHRMGKKYYLYYTVDNSYQAPYLDVAVATSPDMSTGSWTDHGSIGIPEPTRKSWANIDLNILIDFTPGSTSATGAVDPARHVVWGSYNVGLYSGSLVSSGSPLTLTAGSVPQMVIADQATPIVPSGTANRTEAAFHFKYNNYVYLIYSRGNCCAYSTAAVPGTEYVTQVCRATNLDGPYVDREGLDCADGSNGSGTVLLASHSIDENGYYQVWGPGSVGVLVS